MTEYLTLCVCVRDKLCGKTKKEWVWQKLILSTVPLQTWYDIPRISALTVLPSCLVLSCVAVLKIPQNADHKLSPHSLPIMGVWLQWKWNLPFVMPVDSLTGMFSLPHLNLAIINSYFSTTWRFSEHFSLSGISHRSTHSHLRIKKLNVFSLHSNKPENMQQNKQEHKPRNTPAEK